MGDGYKHMCDGCRHHEDDCKCKEHNMSEDNTIRPDFNAGHSEPINDPDTYDEAQDEAAELMDPEQQVAFGVHVVMLADGAFAIQATGAPNLGEMFMLLSRATESVRVRMNAETVAQVLEENRKQQRVITPGR